MVVKRRAPRSLRRSHKRRRLAVARRPRVARTLRSYYDSLSCKRRVFAGQVSPANTSTGAFWSYVTTSLGTAGTLWTTVLAGLSNMAEYDALFDQYTLKAYKFEFHPRFVDLNQDQTYDSTAPTNFVRGYVDVIVDPKNTTVPSGALSSATYNSFCELGNPRTYRADKPFSIFIRPKIQEQYGGGFNRYIGPQPTDISATGMQHRGFHIFCRNQNMSGTLLPQFDVYVTYYLRFKGKR